MEGQDLGNSIRYETTQEGLGADVVVAGYPGVVIPPGFPGGLEARSAAVIFRTGWLIEIKSLVVMLDPVVKNTGRGTETIFPHLKDIRLACSGFALRMLPETKDKPLEKPGRCRLDMKNKKPLCRSWRCEPRSVNSAGGAAR